MTADAGDGLRVRHPLVSLSGDGFVVAETDARVLHASSMRLGLMRAVGEAGGRAAWVTPAGSSLTLGMLRALRGTGGRWIVREAQGFRFAGTGVLLDSLGDAFTGPKAATVTAPAVEGSSGVARTLLSVRIRHEPTASLLLGGAVELLAGVLGRAPTGWGVAEPAMASWSRRRVTEFVRSGMPAPAQLYVAGDSLSATMALRRGSGALLEETHMLLEGDVLPRDAELALRELGREATVTDALVSVDRGRQDLTVGSGALCVPRPVVSVTFGQVPDHPASPAVKVSRFGASGSGRVLTRFAEPGAESGSAAARLGWRSWAEDAG
ncbi:DUF6177 family protein [Pseudoclavibacter sp. RFBG4]|uniref:DUF6177 family protein n=1 Tax=Pseudoclavibacter sp. RFBG4 TaxID=2080575 RepID=UPI0011B0E075|nr:DUF6177 family protein [Pseudoclavibacter sp. RFBG4]